MDVHEFNSLYIKHRQRLISVLKGRGEYNEDVMSDTYLRLAQKVKRLRIDNGFIGFFIGAYKHEWANWQTREINEEIVAREYAYESTIITSAERKSYNEEIGAAIDNVLMVFEQIKHRGTTEYKSKEKRRKCLQLYLQGYRLDDIALKVGCINHSKVAAILWNTIRDVQKELKLTVSPASGSAGVLGTMGTTTRAERALKNK